MKLIRMFALMQILPQGFNLAFLLSVGFFWPVKDLPVYAALCGSTMSAVIGLVAMEYAFSRKMGTDDMVYPITNGAILSLSLPMLMTGAMMFLLGHTGVIILGIFRGETEVGHYAIAVKLATLTSFILNAINSMAGPKFSELFHANKLDELFYVARKSAKLVFFTTAPILLGFVVFGKPILSLVFGRGIWGSLPRSGASGDRGSLSIRYPGSTGIFMNMTGNHCAFRNIMMMAAGVNVVLTLWLTPCYGYEWGGYRRHDKPLFLEHGYACVYKDEI